MIQQVEWFLDDTLLLAFKAFCNVIWKILLRNHKQKYGLIFVFDRFCQNFQDVFIDKLLSHMCCNAIVKIFRQSTLWFIFWYCIVEKSIKLKHDLFVKRVGQLVVHLPSYSINSIDFFLIVPSDFNMSENWSPEEKSFSINVDLRMFKVYYIPLLFCLKLTKAFLNEKFRVYSMNLYHLTQKEHIANTSQFKVVSLSFL